MAAKIRNFWKSVLVRDIFIYKSKTMIVLWTDKNTKMNLWNFFYWKRHVRNSLVCWKDIEYDEASGMFSFFLQNTLCIMRMKNFEITFVSMSCVEQLLNKLRLFLFFLPFVQKNEWEISCGLLFVSSSFFF